MIETMNHDSFIKWLDIAKSNKDQSFKIIKPVVDTADLFDGLVHEKTLRFLGIMNTRLLWLKNDLITISEYKSIYSMKILYRVFLEHWMKAMYLFIRFSEEKNDTAIEEYFSLGSIGEALKHGNSVKSLSIMTDKKMKDIDVWEVLCGLNPSWKDLDKKTITENSTKFEYKSIAKYLIDKGFQSEIVEKIVINYPDLSSYVHGGAFAIKESAEIYDNQSISAKNMIEVSLMLSNSYTYAILNLISKEAKPKHKKMLEEASLMIKDLKLK